MHRIVIGVAAGAVIVGVAATLLVVFGPLGRSHEPPRVVSDKATPVPQVAPPPQPQTPATRPRPRPTAPVPPSAATAPERTPGPEPREALLTVAALVQAIEGPDGQSRMAATRELFRRGQAVLPDMAAAGAGPAETVTPKRMDIVYTLIQGLGKGRFTTNAFGLHVESGATLEEVRRMGARNGFVPGDFRPDAAPNCYVQLQPGETLAAVMQRILTNEPAVVTVNLNYRE